MNKTVYGNSIFVSQANYNDFAGNSKFTEIFTSPNFPPIHQYDNVFTDEECNEIIEYAKPRLVRSLLGVERNTGKQRTSYQVWVKRNALPCIERCAKFVENITGLPVENQEDWQVLRYHPGQEYKPHYDACEKHTDEFEKCISESKRRGWGNRVYTFFIYLNDVPEGGETEFPKLNFKFKPKKGRAIFWHNLTDDNSEAHPFSQHAGLPVISGEKWAINVWIRERPEKY
tara:strand:- start:41 stop:727 length:687 start_codon:yes stop_codon:yes gene_type:complete